MSRTGKSRDKKQISGCLGLGEGVERGMGMTINGYGVSFWGDTNVLKLDYDYSYTNLWIY